MALPRSPLEGLSKAKLREEEIEDAEIISEEPAPKRQVIEVSEDQLVREDDRPAAKPKVDFSAGSFETVNISEKKMQKAALKDMARKGQTLADMFDGDASLAEQVGLSEMMTRMSTPCMVCALSRRNLELLEQELFVNQVNYKDVADRFNITVQDITQHVQECVIDRKASINAGSLVNKLVFEVEEFIARMDSFRMEVDSRMDDAAIATYMNVLSSLRGLIKDVITMRSPDDEAILIVKRIINPLIISLVRELAKQIDAYFKATESMLMPGRANEARSELKAMVRNFGLAVTNRSVESIRSYCEMTGVDPEVVLGKDDKNSRDRF